MHKKPIAIVVRLQLPWWFRLLAPWRNSQRRRVKITTVQPRRAPEVRGQTMTITQIGRTAQRQEMKPLLEICHDHI